MALIRCAECKAKVSDKANACPKCGAPIEFSRTKRKSKKGKGCGCAILILLLGGFIAIYFAIELGDVTPASSSSSTSQGSGDAIGGSDAAPVSTEYKKEHSRNPGGSIPQHTDLRTWTDKGGETVEARYVSCQNGIVRMKSTTGTYRRVPMWNLSQKDQTYVVKTKGWAVVKAYRQADVKASLDVMLAKRVENQKLMAIANKLHGFADNKHPRLFIVYYLPGMEIDAGGWATSHFDPTLEIKILGMTKEEHEHLTKVASAPAGDNVIARWLDESVNLGVIAFLKEDGKIFMSVTYRDGSTGKHELVRRKDGNEIRYSKKKVRLVTI